MSNPQCFDCKIQQEYEAPVVVSLDGLAIESGSSYVPEASNGLLES